MADRCDYCQVRMDGLETHGEDCPTRNTEIREESDEMKKLVDSLTEEVTELKMERCAWAIACMPGLWDFFIAKLELATFSEKEIITEGKRIKNLYGSVEAHRKAFMEAAESFLTPRNERK